MKNTMSRKVEPFYAPLLQRDSSDEDSEERGVAATESLQGDDEEKGAGLPFPKPYRQLRPNRPIQPGSRLKLMYAMIAVIGAILLGIVFAFIIGAISKRRGSPPSLTFPPPQKPGKENYTHLENVHVSLNPTETQTVHPGTETTTVANGPPLISAIEPTKDWQVLLNNTGGEASIRTPDVDGDGLPDVLFGLAHGIDLSKVNSLDEENGLKKYCEAKNEPYPCVGFLLALRGYDGKELWRVPTRSEVMFLMCDLDLNRDGAKDCISTGRQSTVQAVDLRTGTSLWHADGSGYPDFFKETWNVYQATPLPDVDGDGVQDVVIAHGGDPNIEAGDHNRVSGRLIVLSGATGRPLGNYIEMPKSRETYMSTVMYTEADGSQYLLFGSGGETVSGDLMAVTLPDLFEAANLEVKLKLPGKYRWKEIHKSDNIMILYEGKEKGVMVPPVFVDVDNDGVKDMIVSVFEGFMVMLDGSTLFPKWKVSFPNMESYSTPAPGYYDDDEYLDFMVHWSVGAWPDYNESRTFILSGKNGSILWEDRRPMYVMSSDLVLRTMEDHKDCFMMKIRGQSSEVGNIVRSELHGVGVQRNVTRREAPEDDDYFSSCEFLVSEYNKNHATCEKDLNKFGEQVYLMNRDTGNNLTLIHQTPSVKMEYEVVPSSAGNSCIPINPKTGKGRRCVPMVPESRSSDAVTDVDNDGVLDLINVGIRSGRLRDSRFDYVSMVFTTILTRKNINKVLNRDPSDSTHPKFSPLTSQPWLQYLGTDGTSVYKRH